MELCNRLKKRWIFAEGAAVILPPFLLFYMATHDTFAGAAGTYLVLILSILPFFAEFEARRPRPRDMVPIAVMSTIASLGRTLFAAIPSFNPVSAIVLITGMQFGPQAGFLTGALSALASNLMLGQGPWTPWQMYAWGMIGLTGGLLNQTGIFRRKTVLCGYGFLCGILFGWFMNLYYLIGYVSPLTFGAWVTACLTSVWMDVVHGLSTVLFLAVLEKPWGKKLARLKRKYGICEIHEDSVKRGD